MSSNANYIANKIKENLGDIRTFINETFGYNLERVDKCPIHPDETITFRPKTYFCAGCKEEKKKGNGVLDVVAFVEFHEGFDFWYALDFICDRKVERGIPTHLFPPEHEHYTHPHRTEWRMWPGNSIREGDRPVYNGIQLRSNVECDWLKVFDALDIKYEYEPQTFQLANGDYYKPDLFVYYHNGDGDGMWIEIKAGIHGDELDEAVYKIMSVSSITGQYSALINGSPRDYFASVYSKQREILKLAIFKRLSHNKGVSIVLGQDGHIGVDKVFTGVVSKSELDNAFVS